MSKRKRVFGRAGGLQKLQLVTFAIWPSTVCPEFADADPNRLETPKCI